MGTGKVGIVVLNWNRAEDTLECLNSLLPDVRQGLASIICNCSKTLGNWIKQKYHFIVFVDNFFQKNEIYPDLMSNYIICCDNGSTDGSVRAIIDWARQFFTEMELAESRPASLLPKISTQHPAFVLIETGANLGYAKGNICESLILHRNLPDVRDA